VVTSPTDADDEPVEWVDETGRVIDLVPRSRMRRENLRHRSAAVVVTSTDGRLLIHRRSDTKDVHPGAWDVCAGGVVTPGESYADAAARELAEELGVTGVALRPLGVGSFDDESSQEISHVFATVYDGPFEFADGEVAEARFVTRDELRSMLRSETFMPSCTGLVLPMVPGFEPG
jgi:8-oxo-dGTP pyrophosphatase MutT (NUDIX family)